MRWHHHRWLVEREGEGLVFLGKPHNVHSPLWPAVRSPRRLRPEAAAPLVHVWEGRLPAREEIVVDADELDARLRAIVARSTGPDRVGAVRRSALAASLGANRAARRLARRLVR